MAISAFDKKLEILSFVIFLHGKLIRLALVLEQMGEESARVREREAEALQTIDAMRAAMLTTWSGNAKSVMRDLRAINADAQRRVRELEDAVDRIGKLTSVLERIDKAIALVRNLL